MEIVEINILQKLQSNSLQRAAPDLTISSESCRKNLLKMLMNVLYADWDFWGMIFEFVNFDLISSFMCRQNEARKWQTATLLLYIWHVLCCVPCYVASCVFDCTLYCSLPGLSFILRQELLEWVVMLLLQGLLIRIELSLLWLLRCGLVLTTGATWAS